MLVGSSVLTALAYLHVNLCRINRCPDKGGAHFLYSPLAHLFSVKIQYEQLETAATNPVLVRLSREFPVNGWDAGKKLNCLRHLASKIRLLPLFEAVNDQK